jgi:hypothetical protein
MKEKPGGENVQRFLLSDNWFLFSCFFRIKTERNEKKRPKEATSR